MQSEGLDRLACERLRLVTGPADMREWEAMVERIRAAEGIVRIALVGKYVQLQDAYLSVVEALRHAAIHHGTKLEIVWVDAETLSWAEAERRLAQVDGILIPGGFGIRGIEGKIAAARFAREQSVPYLGVCLGMQVAVVEFARHVVGLEGANSSEFEPDTPYPVIDLLPEQKQVEDMGGTMRLGSDPVKVMEGTLAERAYGEPVVYERHRHRYEVNNLLRQQIVDAGLVVSGTFQGGRLVEIVELRDHPWFVASQFHPEFKSRPERPHPLFDGFVASALAVQAGHEPELRSRAVVPGPAPDRAGKLQVGVSEPTAAEA
jgi:CTP synthase